MLRWIEWWSFLSELKIENGLSINLEIINWSSRLQCSRKTNNWALEIDPFWEMLRSLQLHLSFTLYLLTHVDVSLILQYFSRSIRDTFRRCILHLLGVTEITLVEHCSLDPHLKTHCYYYHRGSQLAWTDLALILASYVDVCPHQRVPNTLYFDIYYRPLLDAWILTCRQGTYWRIQMFPSLLKRWPASIEKITISFRPTWVDYWIRTTLERPADAIFRSFSSSCILSRLQMFRHSSLPTIDKCLDFETTWSISSAAN